MHKQKGKAGYIHVVLLFIFLVVVFVSFVMILLNDQKPKVVSLDLKQVAAQNSDNINIPVPKTSELLAPEKDPIKNTPPVAQFTATTPVYVGETVTYNDESYESDIGGSIVNVHWEGKQDFFTKPGPYTVTLKVQDDQGAWSEPVSHVINVMEKEKQTYNYPPIAVFKATNPVYVGENIVYEDGSYDPDGGTIVDRRWDGKQDSFDAPGNYRVTLTVQDDKGKWSDPLYQVIQVRERPVVETQRKPIALFNVTTPVYVGQNVVFTDKSFDPDSGDSITRREWSSNKQTSYNKPGKYDVTLRVQDNHGTWSETYTRTVEVIDSPNTPPVANFQTNSPVYVNQKVEFKNTSYDSDGTITKEQWGGDKRYMYTEPGTYDVTLTVWDDRGAKGSITKKVTVLAANNKAPVAKFRTNSPIQIGEKAYFWDDSYDEDGKITKTAWSGDKREVYTEPGNYQVSLTVWDDLGASNKVTQTIVVNDKKNQKPVAQISGPKTISVNQTATFVDESYDPDGFIANTSWGKSAITKTWSKAGTYTVDLEVTDNRGAKTKVSVSVYVTEPGFPPSGS